MIRYSKPTATAFQRDLNRLVESADFVPFGVLGFFAGAGGLAFGIVGVIFESIWFALLLVLPVIVMWIALGYLRTTTDQIGGEYARDHTMDRAERLMESIRGSGTEALAFPMYAKIFEHAKTHTLYRETCETCRPRLNALKDLIPAAINPGDDADIRQALEFINIRKELG